MSRPRIRIQVAVLVFILLPATLGVVAVHASATCERFVRTYVTKPIRNSVSKQTADAWAKWRIGHPNWKPNPNLHRPKYVMTREEAVQKVDFACTIPTIPSDTDILFTTADLEAPPVVSLPPMDSTQIDLPELAPPEIAELTPIVPFLPIVPPAVPLVAGTVPEPGSLPLALSGMGFISLILALKIRRTEEA
jgi:hypothetical protein